MDYDPPAALRGNFTQSSDLIDYPVSPAVHLRQQASSLSVDEREFVMAAYDEEILFVDQQIERLRVSMMQRGLLKNTLVVFVSDHGEELFDHGGFEHGHTQY